MKKPTAVIVGVGALNSLGAALGTLFAAKGFHVYLAGRTEERLRAVADKIVTNGGTATAVVIDVADERQVIELFETVQDAVGYCQPPSLVVFNVSSFARTPFRQITAVQFEELWRVGCLAGFLVGREAAKAFSVTGGGTMLFSGATASTRGKENYAHFASAKAGLRMVAQSMARELSPLGIHVAHIILDGEINRGIETAESKVNVRHRGEEGAMDFNDIAQMYWQIHQQPRSAWTHEMDLRSCYEEF